MRGFSSCDMVITEIENVKRLKESVAEGVQKRAKDTPVGRTLRGNTHCIILLTSVGDGDGDKHKALVSQNMRLQGKSGSVFFLPAGREYQWEDEPAPVAYDALRIVFTTANEIQTRPFVVNTQKTNKWITVASSIESLSQAKKPSSKARCLSLLYQVLAMLEEVSARNDMPASRQNMLEKALVCIEENVKQPQFSVESLAPMTGMCPTYFRQLFRRMYGSSPKQYLLEKRIKLACELLLKTNLYITAIARESGFSSLYYFSKAFKSATGKSPRAFRESGQA